MIIFYAGTRVSDTKAMPPPPNMLWSFDDLQVLYGGGGEQRTLFRAMVKHKEVWRETKYRGYFVSNHGRVKTIDRIIEHPLGQKSLKGKVLKTGVNKGGYCHVNIFYQTRMVHLLVAAAFLPPKPSVLHEVNHKDLDKRNNRADNLEWMTPKQNMEHSSKISPKMIEEIKYRRNVLKEPLYAIAQSFKIDNSSISRIARGLQRQ